MKRPYGKLKALNNRGFSHIIIPIIAVLVIGGIGTYLLGVDHAQVPPPPGLNYAAAYNKAKAYNVGNVKIGYTVYSNGNYVSSFGGGTANSGGSITKVMLLSAYLNKVGSGTLSSTASSELTKMIEQSDNAAANWVYSQLGSSARTYVNKVATDAGMSGFKLVVQSGHPYIIGESSVTAAGLARLFANIQNRFPAKYKTYALGLLSHISEKVGLLQSGLPGTVYSKEGWTDVDKGFPGYPYVVNQAAQFYYAGNYYGVGITVGGIGSQAYGETVVKNIVYALVH